MNREALGRIVRSAWVQYCIEIGDTQPSHVAPWEALSEQNKEVDRRIGEVVYSKALDAAWDNTIWQAENFIRQIEIGAVPSAIADYTWMARGALHCCIALRVRMTPEQRKRYDALNDKVCDLEVRLTERGKR